MFYLLLFYKYTINILKIKKPPIFLLGAEWDKYDTIFNYVLRVLRFD